MADLFDNRAKTVAVKQLDWGLENVVVCECISRLRITYRVWRMIEDDKTYYFWEARGGCWKGARVLSEPCESMQSGKDMCQAHYEQQVRALLED